MKICGRCGFRNWKLKEFKTNPVCSGCGCKLSREATNSPSLGHKDATIGKDNYIRGPQLESDLL